MNVSRSIKVLLVLLVGVTLLDLSDRISGSNSAGFVSEAQAVVGRPLTPVSVAGVARRTARRCANGTYNC
jgi:hypothetical protein